MRFQRKIFYLALIFIILFQAETGFSFAKKFTEREYEVLVKLKGIDEVYPLRFSDESLLEESLRAYRKRPDVEIAERNAKLRIAAFPNDPYFLKQWYLDSLDAKEGWSQELLLRETRQVAKESIIAVLDTGVDIKHPDLKFNIWVNTAEVSGDGIDNDNNGYIDDVNGWDFISNVSDPSPKFSSGYNKTAVNHGTIISGIAAASGHNGEGISGISWKSKIMPIRVLDSDGNGNVLDVYKGIFYAIKNKANIINMSFVGDEPSQLLTEAVKSAYDAGIIVVAAAGNSSPNQRGVDFQREPKFPICTESGSAENLVIGVTSIGRDNQRSGFANYGSNCVDISAPGEEIFSSQMYRSGNADFSNYYSGPWSGTSLSAPMVSGTLAVMKTLRPDLGNKEIITILLESAKKLNQNDGLGAGKLNISGAITRVLLEKRGAAVQTGEENMVVVALGFESFPQLKVLKQDNSVFKSFFPYHPNFKGPIYVAAGNVDDDKAEEIVTGAGFGGGPHVRVFDIEGRVESQFFAFDKSRRNGVTVALGDIDGDGISEIIAGAGKKSKPEVRIYKKDGTLISSFLAYAQNFSGGVNVAAGDINGDGKDEIVTGPGAPGGPHVRIFSSDGTVLKQFFAFNSESRGGLRVAVGDLNQDIYEEIITAMEGSSGPVIRVFRTTDYSQISEFLADSLNNLNGLFLAVGDNDNDGVNEILSGGGIGLGAQIKIFDLRGNLKRETNAHLDFYKGGARIAVYRYRL